MKITNKTYRWRRQALLGLLVLMGLILVGRLFYLQLIDKEKLQNKAGKIHIKTITQPAYRGMIMDRRAYPLAISTPVDSIWINVSRLQQRLQQLSPYPKKIAQEYLKFKQLADLLAIEYDQLLEKFNHYQNRQFYYLKRHIDPETAQKIVALAIPEIGLLKEYKRYYPSKEVTAQLIGFTNIDDQGQEGLERSLNGRLTGVEGKVQMLKDGHRKIIQYLDTIKPAKPGENLYLSIDQRVQYFCYQALKQAIEKHQADSASSVILNATTGEVLAMVNYPSYNPNHLTNADKKYYRNRAITDVFEPGSTVKPFTFAAGLEYAAYTPTTKIDTEPGYYKMGRHRIEDVHNHGLITVAEGLKFSSNIAALKIALKVPKSKFWTMLHSLGFGQSTNSQFPGEPSGRLRHFSRWKDIDRVTASYGYGYSVTALQLAQAYTVFTNQGKRLPISLLRQESSPPIKLIYSAKTAQQIKQMMIAVVSNEGTARRAKIKGYQVAGKTGTVHKLENGRYSNKYLSLFVGIAPVAQPQFIMVTMVDNPKKGGHYGGTVAAPVFANVMKKLLPLYGIPPQQKQAM